MPKESLQKKVGRVRPPRVQITYDVQVGDAIEKRDIPFVVGVLADLSGMPEKPLHNYQDPGDANSSPVKTVQGWLKRWEDSTGIGEMLRQ